MNKIVLITGATSGIGEASAYKFAENNWNCIITGRRNDRLIKLKSNLENKYNIEVLISSFDVRNRSEVISFVKDLPEKWKKIDVLINNAGLAVGLTDFNEGEYDDWDRMIDTNLKGLLNVSREISSLMISNKKGHIINIGSIAGKETYLRGNVYCATKHAVDSLSKAMRIDLLKHEIKVSVVHPGMVDTEFSIVRYKGNKEKADNVYNGFDPLKGEDIADTVFYIANLPERVNINECIIMPTAQATTSHLFKKN